MRSLQEISRMHISLSSPQDHSFHGFENDKQIQGEAHMLCIVEVVLKLFLSLFQRSSVLVFHLRPTGKPGADDMTQMVVRDRLHQPLHEFRALWARTDKAHIAPH